MAVLSRVFALTSSDGQLDAVDFTNAISACSDFVVHMQILRISLGTFDKTLRLPGKFTQDVL